METGTIVAWSTAGVAVGGLLVKLFDRWWRSRAKSTETEVEAAVKLRQDLFRDLDTVKKEVEAVRCSLDRWKTRFYKLQAAYNELNAKYRMLQLEILMLRSSLTDEQLRKIAHVDPNTPEARKLLEHDGVELTPGLDDEDLLDGGLAADDNPPEVKP